MIRMQKIVMLRGMYLVCILKARNVGQLPLWKWHILIETNCAVRNYELAKLILKFHS